MRDTTYKYEIWREILLESRRLTYVYHNVVRVWRQKESIAWRFNLTFLSLGGINAKIWLSSLGSLKFETDSDRRMTPLTRPSNACKLQTRPLFREGAPYQQTTSYLTEIKVWSWAPDGCLTQLSFCEIPGKRDFINGKRMEWLRAVCSGALFFVVLVVRNFLVLLPDCSFH
jgi:hypothetical protein